MNLIPRPIVKLLRTAAFSGLVLMSHMSSAVTIDIPGYDFAAVADTLSGSTGTYGGSSISVAADITDNLAATWVFSSDNPAYLDMSFSTDVYDGAGVDLSIFFVGSGGHSVDITLLDGALSSSTLTYSNISYTGYDIAAGGSTFGIHVMDIDLADFDFLGLNPVDNIRLNVSNTSAVPSLIGAYNTVPKLLSNAGPPVNVTLGDLAPINQPDGQINAGDAVVMQRFALGDVTPSSNQAISADVAPFGQPDGEINAGDLVVLMRAINGDIVLPTISIPGSGLESPYLVPLQSQTYQSTVTLYGVASPDQIVHLYQNGVLVSILTANSSGGFQSVVNLNTGPNSFYAVALASAFESEPSNIVNVFFDTALPEVDWQSIEVSNAGSGQTTIAAPPGTVNAGQTVALTTQSGESQTLVASGNGSFSATVSSSIETGTTNATLKLGTYEFDYRGLADQVLSFTGTGVYNGTDYIYPVTSPGDIVDDIPATFIATVPFEGYDDIVIDMGFSQAQVINGAGADIVLFFVFDPSNNQIQATINNVTNSLTFSNLYDQSGVQQLLNGVVWVGSTFDNILIQVAEIDLSNYGVSQGAPMNGPLSIRLNQTGGASDNIALSLVGALNIAPQYEPESITAVVTNGGGDVSQNSGNKAVGSLSGTFLVNESGAATYNIPIDVPPGVADMQPELSLNYNSQSGNGLLGLGWSLSGLSAITRCPKTYAQDASYDAISYDSNDRFCLDGQRLVNVSGVYGVDNTVYRTEIDGFSLITQNGTGCGGPCGFTVQTKSGQTLVYGNTDNARRNLSSLSAALHWALSSVSDVTGNTIQFEYYKDTDGDHRIKAITYVNNLGLARREVEFVYDYRTDISRGYVEGAYVTSDQRLAVIRTRAGGKLVKEYRLTYEIGSLTYASRINAISECGFDAFGGEVCIPPTRFVWNDEAIATGFSTTDTFSSPGIIDPSFRWTGDFDGDGKSEVATRVGGSISVFDWDTFSDTVFGVGWSAPSGWGGAAFTWAADFNGDGMTDIASASGGSVFMKFPTNAFSFQGDTWPVQNAWGSGDFTWVGDFNGDGRADIASRSTDGASVYMKLSTGSGFDSTTWPVQNAWGASGYTWVADFNGDGLADIASASGGNLYLKRSTGTGFVSETWPVTSNWSDAAHTWVADFNGDGLMDIATGTNSPLKVKLFTGSGFVEQNWLIYGFPSGYQVQRVFDYNGDGLADIGLASAAGSPHYVVLGSGNGFRQSMISVSSSPGLWGGSSGDVYFGDFDGDGITDFARDWYTSSNNNWNLAISTSSVYKEHVEKIQPAVGNSVDIVYKSPATSAEGPDISCPGYPVQCIPMAIDMVDEYTVGDGIGGTERFAYAFKNPRLQVRGRGFLGFNIKQVYNAQTGLETTVYYENDISQTLVDSYPDRYPYSGMASKMEAAKRRVNSSNIIYDSMEVTEFALKQTTGSAYFPYARVKLENQHELAGQVVSTTTTTTDYDTTGNVTQITAQTVGNAETFTKTTVNQYDPADQRLGRLTRATVTNTTPDGSATRTSGFTYYPNGLLKQEIIEPDELDTSPLKQVTEYEYDPFGNKTKVSVTALSGDSPTSGLQTRITQIQYDSIGLFPVRTINALGYDEHYQYDPRFGLKTQIIGPNQLSTTWEYDALGRLVREMRADGTVTSTDFAWCPASVCPNGGTQVISKTSGSAQKVVYRDAQDREIRAKTEGLRPGVSTYQDTEYDQLGRISRKSRPYYAGDTPQWATFAYDLFDRIATESLPDGGQVVYTYTPLTKTATTAIVDGDVTQMVKTERFDAMGRLRQVDEELGVTTVFEYDPFDNLETVTDDAGNVTTTQHDRRGRKTLMIEPNMGQWEYRYNGFGELTFQQDNKLQQVTTTYDELGRMINRAEPEGSTTWTYDTAQYGVGKLAQVNAPNSFTRTLSYDLLGRVATDARIITGQTFQTSYTYDRYGRVTETTYPSGFATRNVYDTNGILVEVRNAANDALYWQAGDADADGQLTQENFGNNLQTVHTYDPASGRVAMTTTGIGAASDIQFLDYSFDTAGNLQSRSRSEGTTNLTETFVYDALNRLKLASISGIGNKSYNYNSLGNITQKGAVNDYRYAERGAGPHAVTFANGLNYDYDNNGNMVSGAGRSLTWSSYNKPTQIQKGQTTVQFDYGPDRARTRQIKTVAGDTTTTVYIGKLYEEVSNSGQIERKHYIMAGGKAVAIYSDKGGGQLSTQYLHYDHLGSVDVITDESGVEVERLSFAAFGARRNIDWSDASGLLTSQFTTRGFTGHEQLDEVGLVHMNGRVYDPALGRFLSADPQVQFPASSQSHNRYSYVHNNPLSYTDPSGFGLFSGIKKAFKKIGSAIKKVLKNPYVRLGLSIVASYYTFGYVGLLTGNGFAAAGAAGFVGGFITAGTLKGAAIGAASGVAIYGIGDYFKYAAKLKGSAAWSKGQLWFGKIVAHGTVGGATSAAQGGRFADGFLGAGFTQLASPVIGSMPGDTLGQTAAAAVVGGTAAELGGGKFANGATTGAFSYLFNDALHPDSDEDVFQGKEKVFRRTGRSRIEWEGLENVEWREVQIDGVLELFVRRPLPPMSVQMGVEHGFRAYEFQEGVQTYQYRADSSSFGGNVAKTPIGPVQWTDNTVWRPIKGDTTVFTRRRFRACIAQSCN